MYRTNFIVREPLLDPRQRVLGYELSWQQHDGRVPTGLDLEGLVGLQALPRLVLDHLAAQGSRALRV